MKTIERLCKYKDITDLVYRHIHMFMTKDLINEYMALSKIKYTNLFGRIGIYPLFYDENSNSVSCFNWRPPHLQYYRAFIHHIHHAHRTVKVLPEIYSKVTHEVKVLDSRSDTNP